MKLKWDISCPTYIEFLPFIYDILDSSLQEDIGKGNQVRFLSASGPFPVWSRSFMVHCVLVFVRPE